MSKYIYLFLIATACLVGSCQSVNELSIDYMTPSDISFPRELRKVGIVNNTSLTPDESPSAKVLNPKSLDLSIKVTYPFGKGNIVAESLAKSIAEANYFDEVVICDSALRAGDHHARENTLSKDEVSELVRQLQVDLLISIENLPMKSTRLIRFVPEWNCYWGTVDTKVYPVFKVYLPNRTGPMAVINANDSIFWEDYDLKEPILRARLIQDSVMVEEASEFAGTTPIKYLTPYWKSAYRYYYAGGSAEMRDAAIYVREDSWDKAFELWNRIYSSTKNKKKKMQLAHNITLYHEMNDRLEEAVKWAETGQKLAAEIDKVIMDDPKSNPPSVNMTNYIRATLYLQELQGRLSDFIKLNAQMSRFSDDF